MVVLSGCGTHSTERVPLSVVLETVRVTAGRVRREKDMRAGAEIAGSHGEQCLWNSKPNTGHGRVCGGNNWSNVHRCTTHLGLNYQDKHVIGYRKSGHVWTKDMAETSIEQVVVEVVEVKDVYKNRGVGSQAGEISPHFDQLRSAHGQ